MKATVAAGVVAVVALAWLLCSFRSGGGEGGPVLEATPAAFVGETARPAPTAAPVPAPITVVPFTPCGAKRPPGPSASGSWEEVFAAGGRLSWAPPGSWSRGGWEKRWYRGPTDLPEGLPTGVRFNRGTLGRQLESVAGRDHWLYVELNGTDDAPPPELARWLPQLRNAEAVALHDMAPSVAVLEALGGLRSLAWLSLGDCRLPDGGMDRLVPLGLAEIVLQDSNTGDDDLAALGHMVGLERLDLGDTDVTDEGLRHLGSLVRLQRLGLRDTEIHGHGLGHLAGLVALREIELDGAPLTGSLGGFARWAGLPRLRRVSLEDSGADDRAVPYLLGLTRIEWLGVEDSLISGSGLQRLARGLPRCHVR